MAYPMQTKEGITTLYADEPYEKVLAFVMEALKKNAARSTHCLSRPRVGLRSGMFMHFGINTFHDEEWTDGSKPASSYNPSTIDADQ